MKDLEAGWPYCSSSHFGVFHQKPHSSLRWEQLTFPLICHSVLHHFLHSFRVWKAWTFLSYFEYVYLQQGSLLLLATPRKGNGIGEEKWKLVAQSQPTLCNPINCSLSGFSVHGILHTRVLKWVANSFCRRSSQPRGWTWISCIAGRFFIIWATREAHWERKMLILSLYYSMSSMNSMYVFLTQFKMHLKSKQVNNFVPKKHHHKLALNQKPTVLHALKTK